MVCGGITFNIVSIKLRGSTVIVTGTAEGPTPALVREPVAIFGEDGQGIGQGGILDWLQPSRKHDTVTLTLTLYVTNILP